MPPINRLVADSLGTFWLVFGGCGSAVLGATVLYVIASGTAGFAYRWLGGDGQTAD